MAVQYPTPALGMTHYTARERAVLSRAMRLLEREMREPAVALDYPAVVSDYLRIWLGHCDVEVFGVLFLSSQHELIEAREMHRGTLTQTSVYPREIVRAALRVNAGAVILTHNHPGGKADPSGADRSLTEVLKAALALVDVRVLDHIVVTKYRCVSFAERGLM